MAIITTYKCDKCGREWHGKEVQHETELKYLQETAERISALERERDELKWALSAHLAVAIDDPILENNLQKTVFLLEAENAKLKDERDELHNKAIILNDKFVTVCKDNAKMKEKISELEELANRSLRSGHYGRT